MVNPPIETNLLDRYQRLVEITLDLASTLDLDVLLANIVRAAADLSDSEAASILLYDEASNQLHFQAATNMDEPMMSDLIVPVESSLAGWIVKNRQAIIVSNAHQDPRHFGHIEKVVDVSTSSLLGVPLITKNKVVGVLEAINKKARPFNAEDQSVLCALGAQAAVAIENARLFQQSDLISEMVHELRTPLSSMNTAAHLLLKPEVSEEQRRRMVQVIQAETNRLSDMASSYLDLARLESGRAQYHAEMCDFKSILTDCADVMRSRINEKGLALVTDLPQVLPFVKVDKNKIKQVAINLLSNAIKYNRPAGTITLSASIRGREILFSIKDTGPGILPENIPHLFQKFYRVPGTEHMASGTGLGLSICKHIVEAHHGRIEVKSEPGVGTTFTVYLPLKGELPTRPLTPLA